MDRNKGKILSAEIAEALEVVAARHGLTVEVNGGSFDPVGGTFRPKIEFAEADSAERQFARAAEFVGLTADDYGREFKYGGRTFRIVGVNLRAAKYPIVGEEVGTGKRFKFHSSTIAAATATR